MPPRTRAAYLGDLDEYRNEPVGKGPDTVAAGNDPRLTASGFLVTEYGVPGTNDLAMIQAALDAAAPFGAWVLINGERPISGTLNVPTGARIDMSQGRITQNANLTPTFKLNNVNNVRFRNVRIAGKGTDHIDSSGVYAACGIWLAGTTTTDVNIDGGEITGVTGAGIYVSNNINGFRIRNVKIVGPGEPAITPVASNYGACIAMSTSSDFEVTGCDLSLHGQGLVTGEINDFRVSNNYVHDITGQHGLYLEPGARFAIVGNVIKNTALQGIKLQIPVSGSPDADMGVIAGNSVTNSGSHCILITQIPGTTPRARRITVTGNTLSSVGAGGGDGIALFYVAGIIVTGNSVYNVQYGVRCTTGTGLTIALNRINTAQMTGVALTDVTDSDLINNRIIDPGAADNASAEYGIQLAGASSGIKVDGNTVTDATGHMRYGLFLSMTGSGQASCVVRDNDFSGATDYGARLDNTQPIKEWANNVCAGTLGEILNFPTTLIVKGSTKSRFLGTAAPTTGTYRQGDRVDNATPSAGSPIGWVCVAAGTPGTWAPIDADVIDVRAFGAKGDNSTDNTAALNAAFAAATAAKRPLYLPTGTYLAGTGLTVTSDLIIVGDGPSTVIKPTSGYAASTFVTMASRSNVRVERLKFDFGSNVNITLGVFLQQCTNVVFSDVTFVNINKAGGAALWLKSVTDVEVVRCEVATSTRGIVIAGDATTGISKRVNITRNKVHDCGEYGIYVFGVTSFMTEFVSIEDNDVWNITGANPRYPIYFAGPNGQYHRHAKVRGNRVTGNGSSYTAGTGTADGIAVYHLQDGVVTDNMVSLGGDCGIATDWSIRTVIAGNVSHDNNSHGIAVYNSTDVVVSGNVAYTNGWNWDGASNPALTPRSGLKLNNSTGTIVSGNRFTDPAGTQKQDYGIVVDDTASCDAMLGSNHLTGNKTGEVFYATAIPATSRLRENGALTRSATLNFASIAAGATAELTVTLTGAAAGDVVALGPPAALEAGLAATGIVTAADTVTVRLLNTTGGAVDPASATWKVRVSK